MTNHLLRIRDLQEPFHFQQMAKRVLTREKSSYRERNGELVRTIRLQNQPFLIGIRYDDTRKHLLVNLMGNPSAAQVEEAARLVCHMFSTDVDLTDFYRHVSDDRYLAPLIEQLKGTRMVREPDLFESFVKTIIGQQVNVTFAGTLTNRLIALAGDTVAVDGEEWPVFPTPEQVARLEYEQLQQLQFNRRKAEYIIDLARLIVSGELDLDRLWDMPDEAVIDELIRIRGVGRWTAECLLLFGLGRPNLLPAADIGLRNAVRKVYGLAAQPSEKEVREIGAAWSPWSSYATLYLWESLGLVDG